MRIGFVSSDEVNREFAKQMSPSAMQLECRTNGDSAAGIDGWIYDLDQLSAELRTAALEALNSESPRQPVIVLSYSLTDEEVAALLSNGVRIERRLSPWVFEQLERQLLHRNRSCVV